MSFKWIPYETKRITDRVNEFEPWVVQRELHPLVKTVLTHCNEAEQFLTLASLAYTVSSIAFEQPSTPNDGAERIAYTRNAEDGQRERRTTAKYGSYLQRVFPFLPGHEIEKLVMSYRTKDLITYAVIPAHLIVTVMLQCTETCTSCMTKGGWNETSHPYRVFEDPQHGWELVIAKDATGRVLTRCLANDKKFVRIYGNTDNQRYSNPDDPALRAWLEANGYAQISGWSGFSVKRIGHRGSVLAYLDGNCDSGSDEGDSIALGQGHDYGFTRTDGLAYQDDDHDDHDDHDDQIELGNGDWVDEDEARELADGTWVHVDDARELADGTWVHVDDAYYVERHDDYYSINDVIEVDDELELSEDCTYCHPERCYHLTEDTVELWDGDYCHEDNAVLLTCGEYADEYAFEGEISETNDGSYCLTSELETENAKLAECEVTNE